MLSHTLQDVNVEGHLAASDAAVAIAWQNWLRLWSGSHCLLCSSALVTADNSCGSDCSSAITSVVGGF